MPKEDSLSLFPEVEDITQDLTNEQFGQLMRALFAYYYRGEAYSGEDPLIKMGFRFISSQLDRREAAKKAKSEAAHRRWNAKDDTQVMQSDAEPMQSDTQDMQSDAPILSSPIQSYPIQSNSKSKKADKPLAPTNEVRKSYGTYGWVKLSDEEYNRLLNDLGEVEVKRCIAYVDELAQTTRNKNKWRDWNLVIRKCSRNGWGMDKHGTRVQQSGKRELDEDEKAAIRRIMSDDVDSV